jgi:hypothetical protein
MAAKKTLHVRIEVADLDALRSLPLEGIDVGCMGGVQTTESGALAFHALASEAVVKRIGGDAKVEVLADMSKVGSERQKEVGKGNRFHGPTRVPRGLGKKVRGEGPR